MIELANRLLTEHGLRVPEKHDWSAWERGYREGVLQMVAAIEAERGGDMIAEAKPLTQAESDWLTGEGTMLPALAEVVYCSCGADVRGDKWFGHLDTDHDATAIQRTPDWVTDCLLILDEPAFLLQESVP